MSSISPASSGGNSSTPFMPTNTTGPSSPLVPRNTGSASGGNAAGATPQQQKMPASSSPITPIATEAESDESVTTKATAEAARTTSTITEGGMRSSTAANQAAANTAGASSYTSSSIASSSSATTATTEAKSDAAATTKAATEAALTTSTIREGEKRSSAATTQATATTTSASAYASDTIQKKGQTLASTASLIVQATIRETPSNFSDFTQELYNQYSAPKLPEPINAFEVTADLGTIMANQGLATSEAMVAAGDYMAQLQVDAYDDYINDINDQIAAQNRADKKAKKSKEFGQAVSIAAIVTGGVVFFVAPPVGVAMIVGGSIALSTSTGPGTKLMPMFAKALTDAPPVDLSNLLTGFMVLGPAGIALAFIPGMPSLSKSMGLGGYQIDLTEGEAKYVALAIVIIATVALVAGSGGAASGITAPIALTAGSTAASAVMASLVALSLAEASLMLAGAGLTFDATQAQAEATEASSDAIDSQANTQEIDALLALGLDQLQDTLNKLNSAVAATASTLDQSETPFMA